MSPYDFGLFCHVTCPFLFPLIEDFVLCRILMFGCPSTSTCFAFVPLITFDRLVTVCSYLLITFVGAVAS